MKKAVIPQNLVAAIAILLVVPSVYFVTSSFLNYSMGISGPWSLIASIFEQPGNKQLGLNINLLIVFGPIAACIISLFQVMQLDTKKEKDNFHIRAAFITKSYYWIIIAAALFCTGSMLLYFLGENCNCH